MPENRTDHKTPSVPNSRMLPIMDSLKRVMVIAITIMMGLVLFLAVLELGVILAKDILTPPVFFLEVTELLELFGLFLLVLIGIELFETMEMYVKENVVHTEVVFAVALIAVARKVIILDVNKVESTTLVGIAGIIIALSVGYYLIRKTKPRKKGEDRNE